MSPLSASVSV